MSWSVSRSGEVTEVRANLALDFEQRKTSPCDEPEESIRLAAGKLIDQALEVQGYYPNVEVSAYGSMSKDFASGKVANSLSIIITPRS